MIKRKKILITGAAGFIGFHLCKKLVENGYSVVGIDNLNDYYSVNLKLDRLKELGIYRVDAQIEHKVCLSDKFGDQLNFVKMNIEDRVNLPLLFQEHKFDIVCNLAAQAGVRYSIENPEVYIDSNIVGFLNILECCRQNDIKKLVYASSSSIYGNTAEVPFHEDAVVDKPISLYAATKKSNELMAYTYSHLYQFETIGLRFFTVYGPWGRPDMAMFLFTDAILNRKPIKVFNNGNLSRDFTYIDDIINGVLKTIATKTQELPLYRIYNIGNNSPVKLLDYIEAIEDETGEKSIKEMLPMQQGDVNTTWANTNALENDYGYKSVTPVKQGIRNFINWYKNYYKVTQ